MSSSITLSAERWLRAKIDYDFPDDTVLAILYDREVSLDADIRDLSERQKDLCYADLLMFAAGSSQVSQGEYISDGGWQHQKSNKNVVDRAGMRQLALSLYKKWNDPKADAATGGIVLEPLY